MKQNQFQNLRKKCLSSFYLALLLLFSSCVQFDTVRNSQTSFWEGYNDNYKKVYVGKITLMVNDRHIVKPFFKIPHFSNFLNSSSGYSGEFASNVKVAGEGLTAITGFSYQQGNIVSSGPTFIPIKIYAEQGAYYFGDITIKYKTNSNGVTKIDKIIVVDNPNTMDQILQKVPQMTNLKRHNIAKEVKLGTDLSYKEVYKKISNEENPNKKIKDSKVDKAIDSF